MTEGVVSFVPPGVSTVLLALAGNAVPPKSGNSRTVQFTKPATHYFQVDNVQQGRLWILNDRGGGELRAARGIHGVVGIGWQRGGAGDGCMS
jgi:hypothetical protein